MKTILFHRLWAVLLGAAGLAVLCGAEDPLRPRPKIDFEFDQKKIDGMLMEGGERSKAAMAEIEQLLSRRDPTGAHAAIAARHRWIESLLNARRFEDALIISRMAIQRFAMETAYLTQLQRQRTLALRGLGRDIEALANAKVYFNLARLKEVADAAKLFVECLEAAHPNDPAIVERFKRQQMERASLRDTSLPPNPDSVLSAIKIPEEDMAWYEREIRKAASSQPEDFYACARLGNFLLMADRPKEARQVFEETWRVTYTESHLIHAMENVARGIKAEDQGIGRANQFILRHRQRQD